LGPAAGLVPPPTPSSSCRLGSYLSCWSCSQHTVSVGSWSRTMKNRSTSEAFDLIDEAFPQVRYLLLALDGDSKAQHWLDNNSPGTGLFARLLGGDATVVPKMNNGTPGRMDDLFELVDNDDLTPLWQERRPALHLLFGALRGDAEAARSLKREGPTYHRHLTPL